MQVAVKLYMPHVLPRMLTAFFMGGENIADVLIITYVNRGGQRSHCSPKVLGGLTERKHRKASLTAYYCYIFES